MAPTLETAQLTKTFRRSGKHPVHAVRSIDVTIDAGEIVAFLGPNGAGKTTTIDMALGLTRPTSGTIRVLGTDPGTAARSGKVSAVLQTGGLLQDLTVAETVRTIAALHHRSDRVDEVMERTGLTSIGRRRVSKCSGGEQQRLKFALALLPDPDLLILDEPTAGMDVRARHEFWATMRAETHAGRTVVFATHYLEEADAFADRTILISRGEIVADGPTEQVRALTSGRRMSVTIPEDRITEFTAHLNEHGARSLDVQGQRISFLTDDSDQMAVDMLTRWEGHDLEISTAGLEEAFLSLTQNTREEDAA